MFLLLVNGWPISNLVYYDYVCIWWTLYQNPYSVGIKCSECLELSLHKSKIRGHNYHQWQQSKPVYKFRFGNIEQGVWKK